MSKIQTSIQKAIEKSRESLAGEPQERRRRDDGPGSKPDRRAGSGIFRAFQTAKASTEAMEESRFVSAIDDRGAIGAYKVLRTRVIQRMRSNNWHTLLVTSVGAGEGKTLTASNLALSLSRDVNQSVVLVDLDLQRSRVAQYFGFDVEIKKGIGDYLNGNAEIPEIIYTPSGMERISVIPNCEPAEHSSELLSSPRMKQLLEWIRQQSDRTIVIFDMPPITASDDVLAFCPEVDAVLFVASQGQTERDMLKKAMGLLGDNDLLGIVLNKSDETRDSDAYGYV